MESPFLEPESDDYLAIEDDGDDGYGDAMEAESSYPDPPDEEE